MNQYLQCEPFFFKTSVTHPGMLSINHRATSWLIAALCCIINAWSLSECPFCFGPPASLELTTSSQWDSCLGSFLAMDPKCWCFVPCATCTGKVLHHAGKGIVRHQRMYGWEMLRSEEVLVPFFINGCVLSLGWEATSHMNGLRMLYCWHDTGLMVAPTFSSPDKLFSGCLKQSERGFIREKDFTPVLSSPNPCIFYKTCLSLLFFQERTGFFASLLDTRPFSKSLRADALIPACCHSWASSALVVPQSHSWINFRRWSWRLLDFLRCPEALLSTT